MSSSVPSTSRAGRPVRLAAIVIAILIGWLPAAVVLPPGTTGGAATARDATTGESLPAECLGTTGYCGYPIALLRVAAPAVAPGAGETPHRIDLSVTTLPGAAGPDGASSRPWQRGHHTRWRSRTCHRVPQREHT